MRLDLGTTYRTAPEGTSCKSHGLKAVRNQLLKKKAAESMCDEMKLKGDILLNTNNDEVVGLSRSG